MIKFLRTYYYALLPVMFPLILACISFVTGYGGSFTKERIIIFTIGGLVISCLGGLVEIVRSKTDLNRNTIIGIISTNLLFWGLIILVGLLGNWNFPPFNTVDDTYQPVLLWGMLFNAIVFYANALWLYPLFKKKKLWFPYWLCIFILILATAMSESFIDFALAKNMDLLPLIEEQLQDNGTPMPAAYVKISWTIQQIFVNSFYFILSFALVFLINTIKFQETQKLLEEEKLNAELKFLKAQINPHFLFNGINSVYHLIDPKPEIAKSTLLNFSNLLRYQLYECNDDLIPLEKELDHIQDYVAMEKIRRGEDVQIQVELPEGINQVKIPPLLFTPFIENAFKYVSNHDDGQQNKINLKIRLQDDDQKLRFELQNTIDEHSLKSGGGIGLPNIKKRLNLIFPNRYDLDIFKEDNRFIVRMSLTL